jgi:hypothetical protein
MAEGLGKRRLAFAGNFIGASGLSWPKTKADALQTFS